VERDPLDLLREKGISLWGLSLYMGLPESRLRRVLKDKKHFEDFQACYPVWAVWLSRYLGRKVPYPRLGERSLRPLRDEEGALREGVALPVGSPGVAVYRPSFGDKAYLILPPEKPYPKGAVYLDVPYLLVEGRKVVPEPGPPPKDKRAVPFARLVEVVPAQDLLVVSPEDL